MQLTFLTYNIKHGRGLHGVSLSAVARSIALSGADVAGLQEVDRCNPRSGFVHQARRLGGELRMFHAYGPNVGCFFGNAVLSRLPLLQEKNISLPGRGERRGLLRVEINAGGRGIAFYTTHLGLNQAERVRQVERILDILGDEKLPLVLAGDFNALPGAPEIRALQQAFMAADPAGVSPTFPSPDPEYKIDYIFFSRHWELLFHRVYASQASDHLPLAATLLLTGS